MRRIIHLPAALADLDAIFRWTAKHWSETQAVKYLDILDAGTQGLASAPKPGRRCGYLISGLRRHEIASHVVFFFEDDYDLTVIRVLHKNQSTQRHFSKKT